MPPAWRPPDKGDEKIIILRILIESRPHQHCVQNVVGARRKNTGPQYPPLSQTNLADLYAAALKLVDIAYSVKAV